jgi:hypothetical protein
VPTLDVGGISVRHEEKGSGDPVIFVHGMPIDY